MKTIYITENQKGMIGNFINNNVANNVALLNEENRTQKKKCVEMIKKYMNQSLKSYLDTPLLMLPHDFQNGLNPEGALFKSVAYNQNGGNKFIDYLRLNLYSQFGIGRNSSLMQYIPGIARIACRDCEYYSFGLDIDGGKIIEFARLLKLIDRKPEFMLSDITLDADLNGLSYNEFEEIFRPKLEEYITYTKSSLKADDNKVIHTSEYDIIPIPDKITGGYGGNILLPTDEGRRILDKFGQYTDWCVCNNRFANEEFSQYLSNGGKMYICARRGFESIKRPEITKTPLDKYGLSLINVIIGADGLPSNVTTRYNHDFGGENHSEMWEATHLQKLLQVDFLKVFKPRKKEELRKLHLAESKEPSAQNQSNVKKSVIISEKQSELFKKTLLEEGISATVYHFTSVQALFQILMSQKFYLKTGVFRNSYEHTLSDGKRMYYLSTTRNKNANEGYSNGYKSEGSVRITLDGEKLSYKYKGEPVNYWGDDNALGRMKYLNPYKVGQPLRWNKDMQQHRHDETEDRIWSFHPTIPNVLKYIKRIDILLPDENKISDCEARIEKAKQEGKDALVKSLQNSIEIRKEEEKHLKSIISDIYSLIGRRGILFLYDNEKDFSLGNKNTASPEWLTTNNFYTDYKERQATYSINSNYLTDKGLFQILSSALAIMVFNEKRENRKKRIVEYCKKYGFQNMLNGELINKVDSILYRNSNIYDISRDINDNMRVNKEDSTKVTDMVTHWMRKNNYYSLRDVVSESKTPSAQDQVKGKVNAGIMDMVTCGEVMEEDMLQENQNDKLANDFIKKRWGLTEFDKVRRVAMDILRAVPNARYNKNYYLLGVARLIVSDKAKPSEINDILYNIIHQNINLDRNLGDYPFYQLKQRFGTKTENEIQDSVEKHREVGNGYIIHHLEVYDDAYNSGPQDWCITYEEEYFESMVEEGDAVYLVENPEMMSKVDMKSSEFQDLSWEMMEPYNADLGEFGSNKAPYDTYGLSRFIVLVTKTNQCYVYSRWNLTDGFDGEYLTKLQLEELLGQPFNELFPYVPSKTTFKEDEFAVREGAEPESDEYTIGGEGGNNEYFHAINESVDGNEFGKFDYTSRIDDIAEFMKSEGLNVYPFPKVEYNWDEQDGLFIKTGYYLPSEKKVVLFCKDRHPKDILRSYAHEMIHHMQNLNGADMSFGGDDDVKDNDELEKLESEAYLKGNIYFRKWTEYEREKENKKHLNESPDNVEVANISYDDDNACPFLVFKGFPNDPLVGIKGDMHNDLIMSFMNDEENNFEGWDISDNLKDAIERKELRPILSNSYDIQGRYFGEIEELPWAGKIISVYDYNQKNLKEIGRKLIPVIKKINEWQGEDIKISDLDFDDWIGIKCFRYPFSWLLNGLSEIYVENAYSLERNKTKDREYTFVGKNGVSFILDEYGDIVNKSIPFINEEIMDESLTPNEVDLSSFNVKKDLNPKFWKNDKLDSRIRMKLLDIADDFIDFLGVDWVKPEDITITGSLANYNWNQKYSDIDLHIIMDYSKVDERTDFVDNYFYSQKKLWNDEHKDLKIYGFPIEIFVQDINKKHTSSGVYSLEKNKWLTEPERDKLAKKKVNKTHIKNKVSKYTKKIDNLVAELKTAKNDDYKLRKVSENAESLFNEIKNLRKEDLDSANNEINEGNIIFKCLRRLGYIEKITDIINKGYNRLNSLP